MILCKYIDKKYNTSIWRIYINGNSWKNGKFGLQDREGQPLLPCEYDNFRVLTNTNGRNNIIAVKDGKYGILDADGEILVHFIYDDFGVYDYWATDELDKVENNGIAGFMEHRDPYFQYVEIEKDGKFGIFDLEENKVVSSEYDSINFKT